MSTDVELLAAVADGSTRALEELYGRHVAWLTLRLARRCSDETLVEEVVQDAFVAVWRSAGSYDGRGEVGAWLWGIAIRRLVDALRRRPKPTFHLPHFSDTGALTESAEDRVLLGVQHGRARHRPGQPFPGASRRGASDGARRADVAGGGPTARGFPPER